MAGYNIHLAKPVEPAELAAVAISLMNRSLSPPPVDQDAERK